MLDTLLRRTTETISVTTSGVQKSVEWTYIPLRAHTHPHSLVDVNLGLGQTKVAQCSFVLNALLTKQKPYYHTAFHMTLGKLSTACIAYQNAHGRGVRNTYEHVINVVMKMVFLYIRSLLGSFAQKVVAQVRDSSNIFGNFENIFSPKRTIKNTVINAQGPNDEG